MALNTSEVSTQEVSSVVSNSVMTPVGPSIMAQLHLLTDTQKKLEQVKTTTFLALMMTK